VRRALIALAGVAILAIVNFGIFQKEQLLAHGEVILLELAPVDPRSLMQGDYMALNFRLQWEIPLSDPPRDGYAVIALDPNGVVTYRRLDDGTALAPNERRIFYRSRLAQVKLGTNAFFFQEGTADRYANARYGEARLSPNGDILLTGLRDGDRRPLGSASR
jgi:uncharacterized membrane-anchored protein